eukprot:TRINITY_DN9774_c0_g1_i1.p1 TRINITY_DN9774_c0_g1~~TRINITY_DN9774_c0_g1_i1.p1  ORF type:complete len:396 (+),score=58.80 TRINITY_DN9774_c0_g1_i1:288-1475(+)
MSNGPDILTLSIPHELQRLSLVNEADGPGPHWSTGWGRRPRPTLPQVRQAASLRAPPDQAKMAPCELPAASPLQHLDGGAGAEVVGDSAPLTCARGRLFVRSENKQRPGPSLRAVPIRAPVPAVSAGAVERLPVRIEPVLRGQSQQAAAVLAAHAPTVCEQRGRALSQQLRLQQQRSPVCRSKRSGATPAPALLARLIELLGPAKPANAAEMPPLLPLKPQARYAQALMMWDDKQLAGSYLSGREAEPSSGPSRKSGSGADVCSEVAGDCNSVCLKRSNEEADVVVCRERGAGSTVSEGVENSTLEEIQHTAFPGAVKKYWADAAESSLPQLFSSLSSSSSSTTPSRLCSLGSFLFKLGGAAWKGVVGWIETAGTVVLLAAGFVGLVRIAEDFVC